MPPQSPSARTSLATRFVEAQRWLFADALPFWASSGTDWAGWGFWEQFDLQGQRIDAVPRRTRVVARQIFSFMAAGRMGWDGDWRAVVDHGANALLGPCLRPDGLVVSTCDPSGRPLKADFDFYDHSFALFALAQLGQLAAYRDRAEAAALAMLDAMEASFAHPIAGFAEDHRHGLPLRANPHMHLLEACLAQAALPAASPRWRDWSGRIVALALSHFIQPDTGALHEFFDWHWQPMPDASGRLVEPGHQFEWSWLLRWWNAEHGDPAVERAARRLFAIGSDHGVSPLHLAIDELWDNLSVRTASARNWPQTEWLKSCLAATERAETPAQREFLLGHADLALAAMLRYTTTPKPGLWFDRLAADGTPMVGPVPASSLYHLICALEQTKMFLATTDV